MSSLSRYGLTSPSRLVIDDREQDDRDFEPVRPEEAGDPPQRLAASLLGYRPLLFFAEEPHWTVAATSAASHC